MKLRIRDASVRLRLTQSELDELRSGGRVEAVTPLGPEPDQRLVYALEASSDAEALAVRYRAGALTVLIPRDRVGPWIDTDRVGFEGEIEVGPAGPLHVLVEKDFKCLTPRAAEEDRDAFPHPEAEHGHAC